MQQELAAIAQAIQQTDSEIAAAKADKAKTVTKETLAKKHGSDRGAAHGGLKKPSIPKQVARPKTAPAGGGGGLDRVLEKARGGPPTNSRTAAPGAAVAPTPWQVPVSTVRGVSASGFPCKYTALAVGVSPQHNHSWSNQEPPEWT